MRRLIADSGGTKTDWALLDGDNVVSEFTTAGLNPNTYSRVQIAAVLRQHLESIGDVDAVFLAGAGCSTPKNAAMLRAEINRVTGCQDVQVVSDLVGAGIALLGDAPGIIGILGTGSNSAVYQTQQIQQTRPSYGYLLGDEGSGYHIGASFLKKVLEGKLSPAIVDAAKQHGDISEEAVVKALYHSEVRPNVYLSGWVPLVRKLCDTHPEVENLVEDCFQQYLEHFVTIYPSHKQQPFAATGSVAFYFEPWLRKACEKNDVELVRVLQKPMPGMIAYYLGRKF